MYSLKIQLFDSVIYILQLEADKLFPIHRNRSKCSSSLVGEGASVKNVKKDKWKCLSSGFSHNGRNFHISVESV